jgi:hypothetical protein
VELIQLKIIMAAVEAAKTEETRTLAALPMKQ